MCPTRILRRPGGPALPKPGGNWRRRWFLAGWICLDRPWLSWWANSISMAEYQLAFRHHGYVRLPKNIYYYYQSWWTDKDVLHISSLELAEKKGQPIDVWLNSMAADKVELFLNTKALVKDMPLNGHLQWQVNYAPAHWKPLLTKGEATYLQSWNNGQSLLK